MLAQKVFGLFTVGRRYGGNQCLIDVVVTTEEFVQTYAFEGTKKETKST